MGSSNKSRRVYKFKIAEVSGDDKVVVKFDPKIYLLKDGKRKAIRKLVLNRKELYELHPDFTNGQSVEVGYRFYVEGMVLDRVYKIRRDSYRRNSGLENKQDSSGNLVDDLINPDTIDIAEDIGLSGSGLEEVMDED